jgi:O-antigen/teichoic acid export membrane protein
MILARLLTPAQVGVFSLCAAVTAVAGILRDFGISEYLIQEKDLTREKVQAAMALAIITAWSIAAVILLSRTAIADFYAEPGVSEVLGVLCINFLILPFASPAFALLNRELAFRKIYAVQTISGLVSAITSVSLAYLGHGFMSLAWGTVANVACQNIILALLRPGDSWVMPNLKEARIVLRYGTMFVASRAIETLTRNAHEFIIAKQFGFGSVGQFSRAIGLIELFYTNVTSAIQRVATPAFASDHRAGASLVSAYARGTAIFTCIAWPFFGFVALMSSDIIRVLFGPQWDAAAPLATILALVTIPNLLFALGPNILAATGHIKRRLIITLWCSPIHLVGVLVASSYNLEAVAAVWGLSGLAMLAMYVHHLRQILNASFTDLYKPCLISALVAIISIAAQALVLTICLQVALPMIIKILAVSAAGALSWMVAVKVLRHPAFDEITRGVRHLRTPKPSGSN